MVVCLQQAELPQGRDRQANERDNQELRLRASVPASREDQVGDRTEGSQLHVIATSVISDRRIIVIVIIIDGVVAFLENREAWRSRGIVKLSWKCQGKCKKSGNLCIFLYSLKIFRNTHF